MATLSPLEVERLKLLLSGKQLSLAEKISTLDLLRLRFPDFLSSLDPALTKEKLKDNNFLIKYLTNPYNRNKIKSALRQELSSSLSAAQQIELEQSLEQTITTASVDEQPTTVAEATAQQGPPPGKAAGASAGGMLGMPTAPSVSTPQTPIRMRKTPVPEPEISKLYVADKGGKIVEERSIRPTSVSVRSASQGPSEFHVADKSGNIVATYSREPASATAKGLGTETTPSKILVANSSGAIKEAPPKQIYIANSSGVVTGVQNIKSPSWLKTFGSNTQIFAKKNLSRIGQGLFNMGKIGTGGVFNLGARVGNSGLNAIERISRPGGLGGGGGIGKLSKSSNKLAIGLIAGMIFFVLISGVIGGLGGTTPTGQATPINNNVGLDYTLPLRDTSIVVNDIRSTILQQWPNAKIDNWQIIIDQAKLQGWNPAVLLTLWIEESGAQGAASYTDALGCDVGKPTQDIQISLNCFFNSFNNKFTNDQFAQFMLTYSAPNDPFPFKSNPNFPKNFKDWYSKLVPSGPGALVIVTPSFAPQQAIASCPVAGGRITTPSYNASPSTGHCGGGYSYTCKCGTSGRRAKAIDVPTNGQSVVLPTVENQPVTWRLITPPYPVDTGEGGGVGYTFQATKGNDTWYLDMLHLNQSALAIGGDYPSGTPVATTVIGHVHMTMGKNLSSAPRAGSETDCDPNWLPSDFLCQ